MKQDKRISEHKISHNQINRNYSNRALANNNTQTTSKKQIHIKCTGGNKCIYLCVNPQCQQSPLFICGSEDCQCQQQHGLCLSGKISSILKVIKSKIYNNTEEIKIFVDQTIDQIIDQISQLRQTLLIQIQHKIKYSQLFQIEKTFLSIFQQSQMQNKGQSQIQKQYKIKSKDAAILWEIATNRIEMKNNVHQETIRILEDYQKQTKATINQMKVDIDNLFLKQQMSQMSFAYKSDSNSQFRQNSAIKRELSKNQKNIINQLTSKSSICRNNLLSQRLISFFPKRLQKISLLYKASQHNFSIKTYFQLCGSVKNTIILLLTNKDKLGGCYTPFQYCNGLGNDPWVADPERQSFMFSLTNNDKFWLNNKNYALCKRQNKDYIHFGGTQILLQNNANTNKECRFHSNVYYMNEKYKIGDKQSYIQLNGNQTKECTMKQWQVWKVQF